MSFLLESDPSRVTVRALALRGTIALVVAVLLVAGILAKMNGAFDKSYHITAALTDVGDGLPARSDVKFRGVLVGRSTTSHCPTRTDPTWSTSRSARSISTESRRQSLRAWCRATSSPFRRSSWSTTAPHPTSRRERRSCRTRACPQFSFRPH